MARKSSAAQTWPFLFFGAGDASYFEWAEVHVLFEREPSKAEKRKLIVGLPKALSDSIDWEGPALMVASDQFAHVAIAEQFGSEDDPCDGEDDDDDDDDEYDEDGWFFASSAAVSRFNEATEAWLKHAHSVCPILLAYRREDCESGGTQLSDWHAWSVRQLPQLLERVEDLIGSDRDDQRTHMLIGAIEMAHEAKQKVPPKILDWARPERPIERALKMGDGQELAEVLARLGARGQAVLEQAVDATEPAHARALLAAADSLPPLAEIDDSLAVALVCAALADRSAPFAPTILDQARARLRSDPQLGDRLAYVGHGRITAKDWPLAIALFELIIDIPGLGLSGYNNALYAIMRDNNGAPIDRARHLRFVEAALPHGPKNPSIFFNAACVWMELGEPEKVFECIRAAIDHGFEGIEQMRGEPLFGPLRDDPRFVAIFATAGKKQPGKKKTGKKKPGKKKR